jgi:outer membrane biosynthesis protein TonB
MVNALGNYTFLDETKLTKMIILSGFVHFIALFLFVFLPNLSSGPTIRIIPQYTPVALIGPGELGGGGQSSVKPVSVPKQKINVATKKPELIKSKVEPKAISIDKTPAKTKTPPKEEATNSPVNDKSVEEAMNNIREKLAGEQPEASTAGAGTGGGVGVASGGGGGSEAPEMQVYQSIVIDRIMDNWSSLAKELGIKQKLCTIINIRIARDGKVTFQGIAKASGNAAYDDYARQAIQKIEVTSFPPLPAVYQGDYFDMGISFTPLEVNS